MTIEVLNVCKSYNGKTVLDKVCMNISSDSLIAVTGDHGCGKTTLIRILAGLETPDSGQVNLLGDYKYAWINAGTVFQEDRLCPDFSAAVNVAMVNEKLSEKVAREELYKLLAPGRADVPAGQLSPAEGRMVSIVRACIVPSDVRFMDEPFAGMTPEEKEKAVRYLQTTIGHTPLVITCAPGEEPAGFRPFPLGEDPA